MIRHLLFMFTIACCTRSPMAVTTSPVTMTAVPQCLTAAISDDDLDDRAAIQAACDAPQHCAYLPVGVYDVDSIQFTSPARRPYAMVLAAGCTIFGDGQGATIVQFRGSAGGQDWEGIRLTGTAPALHDLTLRTTDSVTETGEQTHAIRILGPSTDPTVYRVSVDHPVVEGWKRGDCVQIVGYNDGRLVTGARLHDNEFAHCDRSGVAVHSGAVDLEIVDSVFPDAGNTALDFEGSGDTREVLIANNRFVLSPGPHGQQEIQLQLVDHVRVTNNVLEGRGIDVYQSDDVRIDHNSVRLTQQTGGAVVAIGKDSSRVHLDHNTLVRESSAGPGSVVRAAPHGTGTPDHLVVDTNVIAQHAPGHVVEAIGLVGLYVTNNVVTYDAAPGLGYGVLANGSGSSSAPGIRTTDIQVIGNVWTGPVDAVINLSGSYGGVGTVTSSGNLATGAAHGIVCSSLSGGRGITGPVTSRRDTMPAPLCGPPGFVAE